MQEMTAVPTVSSFLKKQGLSRYVQGFISEGWDDIAFLSTMTMQDLRKCGVTSGAHQRQVGLDSTLSYVHIYSLL